MSYFCKVEAKQVPQVTREDGSKSKFLGTASLTIDNQFKVTGIQIWEGQYGPYVKMPSYKSNKLDANGKPVYKELFHAQHPDNATKTILQRELKSMVLEAFNKSEPVPGKEGEYIPGEVEYDPDTVREKVSRDKEPELKISARMNQMPEVKNGMLGYGSLKVGDFQLNAVQYRRSIENPGHTYAAMPSYKGSDSQYHDVGYATTKECYDRVQMAVREAYGMSRDYHYYQKKPDAKPEAVQEQKLEPQEKQAVTENHSSENEVSSLRSNNEIRQEIRACGFKATNTLISNIQRLDALTGQHNTLRDIKGMTKDIKAKTSGLSELSKECVNDIVEEVQQQEIDARAPKAPEPPVVEPA